MKAALLLLALSLFPEPARAEFAILAPESLPFADVCRLQGFHLSCIDRDGRPLILKHELFAPEARVEPANIRLLRVIQLMRNHGLSLSTSLREYAELTSYIFTRPAPDAR